MAKKDSKHIEQKNETKTKHYNKSYFLIIAFIIVLIFIIINSILKNTNKNVNNNIQIILNNENITSNLKDDIINENGKIYMSFDDIKTFIDETIYQEETGLIITKSSKKIASLKQDSKNITINGSNQETEEAVIEKNNEKYIAISELENVYDYEFKYIEDTNIVTIDNLNKKCVKTYAKKNINIKKENKMFSGTLEKVKKGDSLIFISEENKIAKVRTQNGNIGYVKSKFLINTEVEREDFIENNEKKEGKELLEYDITQKDITSFEKRQEIVNLILQEAIKNDKMYVKIIYNNESDFNFERFKIEALPILQECGITVDI